MITRRQFLIGTSAGLILPKWVLMAEKFLEDEEEPLLESPSEVFHKLSAISDGGDGRYTLYLDYDPEPKLPTLTWDEFIKRYNLVPEGQIEDYLFNFSHMGFKGDLKALVDESVVFDYWLEKEGPTVKAYDMLEALNLDCIFEEQGVGELIFTHGFNPRDWTPHVVANDGLTLSILQKQLNILGMGVEVVFA